MKTPAKKQIALVLKNLSPESRAQLEGEAISMLVAHGLKVITTERIIDEGELFAMKRVRGDIVHMEFRDDGTGAALTVQFPGAPRLTTVFLGHECKFTPASRRKLERRQAA